MYRIQTNESGTRSMEIAEVHLETIRKYLLFLDLIDSNGMIDESVLEKLKMNVKDILNNQEPIDRDLVNLCIDVIFHNNMKAFGLHQLVMLFINWEQMKADQEETAQQEKA